jgi:Type II secretory pathway, ATPase PulE/Tfp pilus assembly pathway, ATPase PilB
MLKEFDYEKMPIVEIVNEIMLDSSRREASDIHFDPHRENMIIRIRVDGDLVNYSEVPNSFQKNLITRIKIISGMNITESRLPQDGAIKANLQGTSLDMRVSALPTNLGEKIVIRLMDYSLSGTGIENLGFSEENYNKILKMISLPNGILMVTGATGSGKSTTVYAMLQRLNKEEVNIISVEDPVEMNIEGINQVQTNSEIGLDFATVLRSILRQDPNVIMIGEIRDTETAKIAVRASITGHLVLSTIHTNDALNTIERLLDMDVERYLLASAIEGIVAQKLARKLCSECKKERPASQYEKDLFKKALHQDINTLYSADGCDNCHHGYRGRVPIHEVLLMNTLIRDAITQNIRKDELRRLVYSQDVISLLQDGLRKVEKGMTTVEELLKLIDLENDDSGEDTKIGLQESLQIAQEHERKQKVADKEKMIENAEKEKKANASKNEEEEKDDEKNDDDELLMALKALNIDLPENKEKDDETDELIDRTSELDDILSGLDFSDSDGLSEEDLRAILKDS